MGFEEHINLSGLPNIQFRQIMKDLRGVFDVLKKRKVELKKIVILGDLKHEFGGVSDREWRETVRLLDYLLDKKVDKKIKEKIILVKGNHDNILGPIAKKRNLKLKTFYRHKDIVFMHGHQMFKGALKKEKILILGHLHPSVTLKDKYKKEKYKCFLKGKWKKRQVYILPSFSNISLGYDVSAVKMKKHNHGHDFLIINESKLKSFNILIYNNKDKKEHDFGKLRKLIK